MRFPYSTLSLAILGTLSTSAFAEIRDQIESNHALELETLKLNTIVVEAKALPEIGRSVYTKEDLQKTPNSSKSITDFLKVNPNVQFSNDQLAASQQADLKPNEISIHGAQSYQNKFIINGVSNTNTLDPNGSGTGNYGAISGGSQGVALNTDLLCNLEVLDSNISAKYSGFTGGVIQADTCTPTTPIGQIHGSVTYDYTSSDWSSYYLTTDADKNLFEGESTQSNQKDYTRQGLSTNIYGKLSEQLGFDLYASQRQSVIPVKTGLESQKIIDQKKSNTNIGATAFIDPDTSTSMKLGFTLGKLESNNYAENRRNSHNTINNDSALFFAELSKTLDTVKITQKLNYQKIDNARVTDQNDSINWLYAAGSKDWNKTSKVMEGGSSASINLKQSTFTYELDAIFNQYMIGSTKHHISGGLGYSRDEVKWQRPKDFTTYYGTTSGTATNLVDLKGKKCQANDPLCDEAITAQFLNPKLPTIFQGQYFNGGTRYKAGNFEGLYGQAFVYVEDDIHWKNFKARFGIRTDYDEPNSNLNIAPRTRFSYKPYNSDLLEFTTGWSRYYSAPTYITDLHQELLSLDFKIKRTDQNAPWTESINYNVAGTRKSDLKTPYADEFIFGIGSQYKNTNIALKWVNRQYKDEISRNRTDISVGGGFNRSFEFGNSGYGKNDTITLNIDTISPLQFKGSNHHFGLAVNYSETFRGTPDYSEDYNETDMMKLISFNGDIIYYADRPATNFNQPFTARGSWDINFDHIPVSISNFLSYKDSYKQVLTSTNKVIYEGEKIDTYTLQEVKPRFTWDIRSTYDLKLSKNSSAIFGLTINNLTNRNNLYVSGSKLYSEIGRQFVADVTFKF